MRADDQLPLKFNGGGRVRQRVIVVYEYLDSSTVRVLEQSTGTLSCHSARRATVLEEPLL